MGLKKRFPLALVPLVAMLGCASGGTDTNETTATTTKADKTLAVAKQLSDAICSLTLDGSTSVSKLASADCDVDGMTPGVVTLKLDGLYGDADKLTKAGEVTGLWGPADVKRMGTTRALDGTQKTADGKVSWTYHPDNGLQIVAEVS